MEMLEKIFAFGESAKLVLRGPRSRDPIGPTAQEISRGESWSSAKWFESSRERERERERKARIMDHGACSFSEPRSFLRPSV